MYCNNHRFKYVKEKDGTHYLRCNCGKVDLLPHSGGEPVELTAKEMLFSVSAGFMIPLVIYLVMRFT